MWQSPFRGRVTVIIHFQCLPCLVRRNSVAGGNEVGAVQMAIAAPSAARQPARLL